MPPPPSKKRKLPTSTASAPTPKRTKNSLKISKIAKPVPRSRAVSKKAAAPPTRKAVDPSALSWHTVDEDEFGGLQIIENVGVAKDDRGGVKFMVSGDNDAASAEEPEAPEDEFEGFGSEAGDDDDGAEQPIVAAEQKEGVQATSTTKEPEILKEKKKADKGKKKQKADDIERLKGNGVGNAFSLLTDAKEDEDPEVDVSDWLPLRLSSSILTAVSKLGFSKPTQIQEQAIPQILKGGDVVGKAETGSGKTLAFGIPIVEKWLELHGKDEQKDDHESEDDGAEDDEERGAEAKGPMALLLSPTRELAKQISDHIKALCASLPRGPYIATITGGLSIQKQQRQLTKADIVIATPGRLWEVLDGDAKLQEAFTKMRFLVVDEADRLLKAGQFKEVQDIIGALNRADPEAEDEEDSDEEDVREMKRQTLIFSATFDKGLQMKLAGNRKKQVQGKGKEEEGTMEYLMKCLRLKKEAKFVDVNPVTQMATGLREGLIECGAMEKDLYLYTVLVLNPNRRTLIFTNSISSVRRIAPLLQNLNLNAHPLHSQMIQKARLRSLERFTSATSTAAAPASKGSILVATDVAARGLDIPAIDQVIHYHVPRAADTYVHRSGRTARASSSGVSILLCAPDEVLPTRRLTGKVHVTQGRSQRDIQSLPVDRKIAQRLKSRVDLAKKLADAVLAKEKANSSDQWLRSAAEDLGVDYDSDEFEIAGSAMARGGRGGGRKRKEKEARDMTKMEMRVLRAELREELGRRVNLGVSERYITGGRVDVGRLLREREQGMVEGVFLGGEGLGLEF